MVNVKFVVATSIKLNEFAWTEGGDYASNDTGNILAGALLEPGVEAASLSGNDTIIGRSKFVGLLINGVLSTGGGRDELTGVCDLATTNGASAFSIVINDASSIIRMGAGGDLIHASSPGHGFMINGNIYMGDGNDYVYSEGYTSGSGNIYFGKGSDSIEARFGRNGAIEGEDNTRLKLFGGSGQDRLKLQQGGYTMTASSNGYILTSFYDEGDGGWNWENNTSIEITSFEYIDSGSFQTLIKDVPLDVFFSIVDNGSVVVS